MSLYAVMNALLHPDLTPNETRLYAYLTFRANGARVTWPSVPEMMQHLDVGRDMILAGTKKLAAMGLIRIQRRFADRNLYHILDRPGMEDCPRFPGVAPAVNEHDTEGPTQADIDVRKNPTKDVRENPTTVVRETPTSMVGKHAQDSVQQESINHEQETDNAHASARDDAMFDGGPDIIATANARPIPDIEDAFPFLSEAPPPKPKPRRSAKPVVDYVAEFAATFWPRYPRKVSKGRAEKTFIHWRKAGIELDIIMLALSKFEWPTRKRFYLHASTWLNDRPWETMNEEDEPEFDPALRAAGFTPETAAAAMERVRERQRADQSPMLLAIPGGRDAA